MEEENKVANKHVKTADRAGLLWDGRPYTLTGKWVEIPELWIRKTTTLYANGTEHWTA